MYYKKYLFILFIIILIFYIIYKNIFTNNDIDKVCIKINNIENLDMNFQKVYILKNILSLKECKKVIKLSENYGLKNEWSKNRHISYPTTDILIKNIPDLNNFIENIVYTKIIPFYKLYYKIPSEFLVIDEIFIVKYSMNGQKLLRAHEDGSDFSFIITLNKDFSGGGTHFINLKEDITCSVGDTIIFCGKNRHKGIEITKGTRYILTGFLSFKNKEYCDRVYSVYDFFNNFF
jgi:hypothetical protein